MKPAPELPPEVAAAPAKARFGKFVCVKKLGAGGMGEVWKAWDAPLGRWVALKFLKGGDDDEIARFKREAQTAGKLSHPNIAAIYEVGEQNGRHYIAMQYIEGETLTKFPRTDLKAVVRLLRDAAQGLAYAHQQGVVHRDIKPENIMTTVRGKGAGHHVFVMDFGLARAAKGDSNVSIPGTVMGTPSYMSPEQARGERVGARSDVYSLGGTLYTMVTGHLPFKGKTVYDTLRLVSEEDPKPPRAWNPRVESDLETIILKCLDKSAARRYANAKDLAEELTRWVEGEAILAHPPSTFYRLQKYVAKRKVLAIPVAAMLAAALVLGIVAWTGASRRAAEIVARNDRAARLEREGEPGKARDEYRAVLLLDRANGTAKAGLKRAEEELARRKAEEERKARELAADAARAAEKAALEQEAFKLLELGRPALDKAQRLLYRKDADYDTLVRRVEEGQRSIAKAADLAPHLPLAQHLLGVAWEIRGEDAKAEECWRKAVGIDTAFAPSRLRLGRLLLDRSYLFLTGGTQAIRDAYRPDAERLALEAAKQVDLAGSASTGEAEALQRDVAAAMLAYARADNSRLKGLVDAGLARYKGVDGEEEFHWLAGLLASKPRDAIVHYDRAIDLRPQFPLALFSRGMARDLQDDLKGALADLNAATSIKPKFVRAIGDRAMVRRRLGDSRGALADCDEALRIDPSLFEIWLSRGLANSALKRFDDAIEDYTRSIRLRPDYWIPYINRGALKADRGDLDGAIQDYGEALRASPGHAGALINRALARRRKGDRTGAAADLREAMKFAAPGTPEFEDARKLLADIEGRR